VIVLIFAHTPSTWIDLLSICKTFCSVNFFFEPSANSKQLVSVCLQVLYKVQTTNLA